MLNDDSIGRRCYHVYHCTVPFIVRLSLFTVKSGGAEFT